MIKTFGDLEIYKKAKKLYPEVVQFSRQFPNEGFHLRDQLCRAANSIQANIAEGFGRSAAEFKMYLTRSLGSCNETISHISDAINTNFGEISKGSKLFSEYDILGKQIYRLRESWK